MVQIYALGPSTPMDYALTATGANGTEMRTEAMLTAWLMLSLGRL